MQGDGNLVIDDKVLLPHWSTDTMEARDKTDNQRALRLLANVEPAIVDSIRSGLLIKKALVAGYDQLPLDRLDVFLRNG